MYCQKCGKKINDNDMFCGYCGARVLNKDQSNKAENQKTNDNNSNVNNSMGNNYNPYINNNPSYQNNNYNMYNGNYNQNIQISNTLFGKFFINYFKGPGNIYKVMKNDDVTKLSIGMIIAMPILYAVFHLVYFMSFFRKLVNNITEYIQSIVSWLSKFSEKKYSYRQSDFDLFNYSSDIANFKEKLHSCISSSIDMGEFFIKGFIIMVILILIAFIVIEVFNAALLKNSIKQGQILFIASSAYIPLLLALILNNLVIFISISATFYITILGSILSIISIYTGISEYSKVSKNRNFITVSIMSAVLVLCGKFIISLAFNPVLNTLADAFKILG